MKFKKVLKNVENLLAAASFAEEGESEAARTFLKEGRRVLLALKEGWIDPRTLKYALNTAERVDAQLDILYVSNQNIGNDAIDHQFRHFESELNTAGIRRRFTYRTGCLKQAIIDYTKQEKEILFVVIESPDSADADCDRKDAKLTELRQKMKCPLVVVMGGAGV